MSSSVLVRQCRGSGSRKAAHMVVEAEVGVVPFELEMEGPPGE